MANDNKEDGTMKMCERSKGIRSFTLIEIMIALVILGVLATIAIPSYQNFIEDNKAELCATNLEALKSAFDIYMVEHNVVPGDLGELSPEVIDRAFAQAISAGGWRVKLALFLENRHSDAVAYASLINELGQGNLKMLICPSDKNVHRGDLSSSITSYGINNEIQLLTKTQFEALSLSTPIIADSASSIFTAGSYDASSKRHRHWVGLQPKRYANIITKGGWVKTSIKNSACAKCDNICVTGTSGSVNKMTAQCKNRIRKCWKNCFN